jgi:predicted DNA-binding transcriptional regulator YafY
MGDHLGFERYFWFDKEVRAGYFPNASKLADAFELSIKTAQRAIEYMRDRIHAPLEYSKTRRGYYYRDNSFELPNLHISQEELLAILMARNILSHSAGGAISRQINKFGKRLFAMMGDLGLDERRMEEAFSANWTEYAPTEGPVFQKVTRALLENRVLECFYTSPKDQLPMHRAIEPHHLQHYMGTWTMIGFCRMRSDWRRFILSRISDLTLTKEKFEPKPKSAWGNQLEGGFGIFQGGKLTLVKLRFNPFRAAWIKEQVWHPKQIVSELPGGSLVMAFPVCELHEVKMKVLQFGGDVEVIEPLELREEVLIEIRKMGEIYR